MTDREMLELAAKAAGIRTPSPDDMDLGGRQYEESLGLWCKFKWGWNWWNPLADDGDALRLAVTLAIGPQSYAALGYSHAGSESVSQSTVIKEQHNGDPYAATRRAITRAAAEIGRQMEVTK